MKKSVLLAALFAFLTAAIFAQNAELPRLAVVQFTVNTARMKAHEDAIGIRNLVRTNIVASGNYMVITRDEIDKLLENQNIQVSSISSAENIRKLQMVNINYIVTGTVDAMDNDYSVTISMLDVSNGKISHQTSQLMNNTSADIYDKTPILVRNFQQSLSNRGVTGVQTTLYQQLVNATGTTTITITQDTPFQGATISKASSVTLRGDTAGRTIFSHDPPEKSSWCIRVERGVTLILENITLKGICIEINEGGTLVMDNSSVITGSSVFGVSCNGTFIMNGGSITSNSGSGVLCNGTFIMNGGNITNNNGWGVYVERTFTMNGGSITNNGNGIFVEKTFTMNGGSITNNNSWGVLVEGGTFTMNDGRIINNNDNSLGGAEAGGGGVRLTDRGTFTMRNGRIENNQTRNNGGGVYVNEYCNFDMQGGVIAGNRAGNRGGGVNVYWKGIFLMTGGTVYGSNGGSSANIATGRGNAIYDTNKDSPVVDRNEWRNSTIYKWNSKRLYFN